ncbi:MAG: hypothetical protein HQK75_17605 [Candidatus Magnetomorum sp.]|nr:hypothetical protein [Candidatus Magnetomorum sp.]
MVNFFNTLPETLPTIIILSIVSSIMITSLIILLRTRRHKYDFDNNRTIINEMRDSFEKTIYNLTERLVSTQDRWMDVNHLLLSSQQNKAIDIDSEKRVYLNDFLKSNGINEADIKTDKKLVFFLTPFNKDFESTFEVIRKVCHQVDLKCLRGDEEFIKSDIFSHILKNIVRANIVIANIDGRNSNVFYELGLAHALDKNTILIAKTKDELPIDVKSKYMILYKNFKELETELKNQLLKIYSDS